MQIQPPLPYTFSDCFTYSPNWYIQSTISLHPSSNLLFYCSNSLLYILSTLTYKVTHQIQCRQILKQKQYPLERVQNAKANSVLIVEDGMLVGMNDGIILVLGKGYQVVDVVNTNMRNIYSIMEVNKEKKEYLLVDDYGSCGLWRLGEKDVGIKVQGNKMRVKKVGQVGNNWIVFYQNGEMYLFNQDFSKQIKKLKFFKEQLILSLDISDNNILILSRKGQDDFIITYCQYQFGHQVPLEHTRSIYQISKNVNRCSISIAYNKKYQYKQKDMRKASLIIKWLSPLSFILSGKVGELYIFQTKNCLGKKKIQLKPLSHVQENSGYQLVPDSHHYQDIYAIYTSKNVVVTIGTDRNMTFWKYQDSLLNYVYQIKFLASKVRSIFKSQAERNNCFLLMQNSVVRSWDVESRINGEGLMNEYWKLGNRTKVERIANCPDEEGIVAVLGPDSKVIIFDLHEERVIKEINVGDDTKHVGFVNQSTIKRLSMFLQHEPYQVQIQQKQFFPRTFSKDCYLVMYDKNYISFLNLESKTCQRIGKFFQQMINKEFVEDFFFFEQVVIAIIKSPATFNFYLFNNGKRLKKYEFEQQFVNNKYYVRILSKQRLIICLWKNKEINLFLFDISTQQLKIVKVGHCTFNYNINYCQLSANGFRLLCYSNLNSTLQVWQLDWNQEQKIGIISKNIKAHQAYVSAAAFWGNKYAISCSYDQNVKVWDCDSIPERAPPKGTKIKKKKKKIEAECEVKQKEQQTNKAINKQQSSSSDQQELLNKK